MKQDNPVLPFQISQIESRGGNDARIAQLFPGKAHEIGATLPVAARYVESLRFRVPLAQKERQKEQESSKNAHPQLGYQACR